GTKPSSAPETPGSRRCCHGRNSAAATDPAPCVCRGRRSSAGTWPDRSPADATAAAHTDRANNERLLDSCCSNLHRSCHRRCGRIDSHTSCAALSDKLTTENMLTDVLHLVKRRLLLITGKDGGGGYKLCTNTEISPQRFTRVRI